MKKYIVRILLPIDYEVEADSVREAKAEAWNLLPTTLLSMGDSKDAQAYVIAEFD